MKKLCFSIIIVITSYTSLNGQQYLPLAVEGNTWSVSYQKYFVSGDTVLGGTIFKKIYAKEMDSTFSLPLTQYACAMKDSSDGRTYFWPRNESIPQVLYDWNLSVGDSIKLFTSFYASYGSLSIFISNYFKDVVSNIDSVFIYDQYRKRMTIPAYNMGNWPYYWIEGIGCLQGPFANSFANMPTDVDPLTLVCFHRNDTLIYHNYVFGGDTLNTEDACYKYHTLGLNNQESEGFDIYPNPSSDILMVQTNSVEQNYYDILSLDGKLLISGIQSPINISHLPSGIYFLTDVNKTSYRKFIKN